MVALGSSSLLFLVCTLGEKQRKVRQAARNALNLEEVVQRKLGEVERLEKEFGGESDIGRRLSYASTRGKLRMSEKLRRKDGSTAVIADVKRRGSNGIELAKFSNAALVSSELAQFPIDAVCIGVDQEVYGGQASEIMTTWQEFKEKQIDSAIIAKDFIVAPIQIAMYAELGADAVILIATMLGSGLENLLNVCTIVGIEALVEVHTPDELRFALNAGASSILVNNFDRIDSQLSPNQALGLRDLIPPNVIAVAAGGITDFPSAKRHLAAGYDAILLDSVLIGTPPDSSKPFVQQIRSLGPRSPLQAMSPTVIEPDDIDDDYDSLLSSSFPPPEGLSGGRGAPFPAPPPPDYYTSR